jgi:hypothetical protein
MNRASGTGALSDDDCKHEASGQQDRFLEGPVHIESRKNAYVKE